MTHFSEPTTHCLARPHSTGEKQRINTILALTPPNHRAVISESSRVILPKVFSGYCNHQTSELGSLRVPTQLCSSLQVHMN